MTQTNYNSQGEESGLLKRTLKELIYDILQERALKTKKRRNINKQKACLSQTEASSKSTTKG